VIYSFDGSPSPVHTSRSSGGMLQTGSGLSDAEIQRLRDFGDTLDTTNVKLFGRSDAERVLATGSRFDRCEETEWLYQLMAERIQQINAEFFGYDLTCFAETFYYLSYGPGEHFNWHVDAGSKLSAPRKLSMVVQLSDPSEYEGGEFDVLEAVDYARADRVKGLAMVFPAYKIHRVTPVTRGKRRTLAIFACGPSFR
jgi:PKHD-type hydroxylase